MIQKVCVHDFVLDRIENRERFSPFTPPIEKYDVSFYKCSKCGLEVNDENKNPYSLNTEEFFKNIYGL